jgi:hypothetical protein
MDLSKFDVAAGIKYHLDYLAQADSHPAIEAAEKAVIAAEGFLNRLMEIYRSGGDVEDLIAITCDELSGIVGRAVREEEDDRVNGSFRRSIDAHTLRAGV